MGISSTKDELVDEYISSALDMERFWYWINERHRIWMARRVGSDKPWTQDPILQEYRFCNVFRELDTVTQWIDLNWRQKYKNNEYMWLAMAIARFVNWPPTLADIGFPVDGWTKEYEKHFIDVIEMRIASGQQAYTGAYMVRGDIQGGYKKKSEYLAYKVLRPISLFQRDALGALSRNRIQLFVEWLSLFYGFSGFMGYEIATDLRHTKWLRDAEDIYTWANAGPGAIRGLNRIWGVDVKKGMKQGEALEKMRHLLRFSEVAPLNAVRLDGRKLEMRDIEHSLCEYDKYERVRLGEGRPRSKYPGRA